MDGKREWGGGMLEGREERRVEGRMKEEKGEIKGCGSEGGGGEREGGKMGERRKKKGGERGNEVIREEEVRRKKRKKKGRKERMWDGEREEKESKGRWGEVGMGRKRSRKGERKGKSLERGRERRRERGKEDWREELWGLLPNNVRSGPEISGVQFVLSLGMGIWRARSPFLTREQVFSLRGLSVSVLSTAPESGIPEKCPLIRKPCGNYCLPQVRAEASENAQGLQNLKY